MPYLDAPSPASYLSTRLGRSRRGLGDGVAYTPPRVWTPVPPALAPRPTTTVAPKPTNIVPITSVPALLGPNHPPIPFAPIPSIPQPHFLAPNQQVTTTGKVVNMPPPPPPQQGSPQGQIPNGPSNLPPGAQGGGFAPSNAGGNLPPSGPDTSGGPSDGSSDGGLSIFAALPWYVWVVLGLGGFYVARKVMA